MRSALGQSVTGLGGRPAFWLALAVLLVADQGRHSWVMEASAIQPEPSPLAGNPDQQAWVRSEAAERQKRHQMRVELPQVAFENISRPGGKPAPETAPSPAAEDPGGSGDPLVIGGLLACVFLAAAFFLLPEKTRAKLLFRRTGHLPEGPGEERAETLAEAKAFADFMVAFKIGPMERATPRTEAAPTPEGSTRRIAPQSQVTPAGLLSPDSAKRLMQMRQVLQSVRREQDQACQRQLLRELEAGLHAFVGLTSASELLPLWQVASVTEGLVGQLANRAPVCPPNTLRTVAVALDLLVDLSRSLPPAHFAQAPPIRILAVDDDLISRHAVGLALRKAFNQPDVAVNGQAALAQCALIGYDVIFLDILMPDMNGFELCSKIRQTALNRTTPIVFVTSLSDFNARARSNLCGGNDFVSKPFLTFEVTVKALVLTMRGRLQKQGVAGPGGRSAARQVECLPSIRADEAGCIDATVMPSSAGPAR